jgi:hypothetical protein
MGRFALLAWWSPPLSLGAKLSAPPRQATRDARLARDVPRLCAQVTQRRQRRDPGTRRAAVSCRRAYRSCADA